jgi:hypothetical protein
VTPFNWVICWATIVSSISATVDNAQEDNPFGPHAARENGDPRPRNRIQTRALDDLFGDPIAIEPSAPKPANERSTPPPTEPQPVDVFVPTTTTVQAVTPNITSRSRDDFCKCEGDDNSVAVAQIKRALSSPLGGVGLDYADSPLEAVISDLQERCGLPIQIDTAALDNNGIGPDAPVTINVRNITLQSGLRLILRPLQLTYVIKDEVLMVTTQEEADSQITVCVYDVRDLIDGSRPESLTDLTNVLTSCIRAEKWQANGGKGSIRSYSPNLLVIAQTQAVHDQIRKLLETMRQMRQAARVDEKPIPVKE